MKKILLDIGMIGVGFFDEKCRTGVYRCCLESLQCLYESQKKIGFALFTTTSVCNDEQCKNFLREFYPELLNTFVGTFKGKPSLIRKIWWLVQKKYALYFSPVFEVPRRYNKNLFLKKIVIIHDLIQVMFPQYCHPDDPKNYKKFLESLDKKTFCLCNSECTKNDFLAWKTKVPAKNVCVIPLGADKKFKADFSKKKLCSVLQKYNLKNKKYFFGISSINPRKNFKMAIDAFEKFKKENPQSDLKLVIAGPPAPEGFAPAIKNSTGGGVQSSSLQKIIFTGFVAEEDLPGLYAGALASVYISLYEGFGLPALESIYCKTPVIASNASSIPAVVGKAGILVNPQSIQEVAQAYSIFARKKFDAKKFECEAKKQIAKYTWQAFDEKIVEEIKKIL